MLRPVIKIRLGYGTFVCFSTFTRLIYCHIYNLLFYHRKYYLNESLQLIFYKCLLLRFPLAIDFPTSHQRLRDKTVIDFQYFTRRFGAN